MQELSNIMAGFDESLNIFTVLISTSIGCCQHYCVIAGMLERISRYNDNKLVNATIKLAEISKGISGAFDQYPLILTQLCCK